jgi:hypothetical protein
MLEGALANEDGFAEVVANEDKVEKVTLALMMVILSHAGVLGISVKASYQ